MSPDAPWFTVDQHDRPVNDDLAGEVRSLARAAGDADGTYPLAEDAVLRLRPEGDAAVHLVARATGRGVVGYAQIDPDGQAELVVHPDARRRGIGRALATEALAVAAEHGTAGGLRVWAHGDHPAAAALARALGFARTRALLQLRRPLATATAIPAPALPAGMVLRSFQPGRDDQAWLAVNARAFADHPEQGRWTVHDLRLRFEEPWFDPDGFLLAIREPEDRLLGFHWTKVHSGELGEVYVLGVDPDAHGTGLGTALTLAGLRYLRDRGLTQAMLYVDESNTAAVALYTKLGFTQFAADVTYARDPQDSGD